MNEHPGPPVTGGPVLSPPVAPLRPFQLSLPGFEGPLELLVLLTEREKLDITTVSLVQVTAQYLGYFHSSAEASASALADFVAMAARLLLLKSRRLLPRSRTVEEPEAEDPDQLADTLRIYRAYRDAAVAFGRDRERVQRAFPHVAPAMPTVAARLREIPIEQLAAAMQEVLQRSSVQEAAVPLPPEIVSVAERAGAALAALRDRGDLPFSALIARSGSRLEIVVSFIAVLHLVRDGLIDAVQAQPFGEITLRLRERVTPVAAGP